MVVEGDQKAQWIQDKQLPRHQQGTSLKRETGRRIWPSVWNSRNPIIAVIMRRIVGMAL